MERIAVVGSETNWGEVSIAVVFMVLLGALVLVVVWQLLRMARDKANRDHDSGVRNASDRVDGGERP